jgi:colicin import membrane protein
MPQEKDDSVRNALDEILGIESERVKQEDASRKKQEEETRRAKEESERRAREEAERIKREEEQRRVDEERRQRDEESNKLHLRQLAELRTKQEIDAKARLAEEEMRLRHEKDIAVLDAQKKKIPMWVWIVIGVVILGGGATGTVLYLNYQKAEEEKVVAAQKAEQDRLAREKQLQLEREKLRLLQEELEANRRAQAEADRKIQELMDQITSGATGADQLAKLQEQLRKAQEEKQQLADNAAKIKGGRGGGSHTTSTGPAVTKTRKCINQGTPLEECFMCPGDPRC